MSSMICGKCQSESTYYQDGMLACMKCGNRSPSRWGFHKKGEEIKAPDPIEVYEPPIEDEEIDQEEEMNMGKKRTPEQRERIAAGIRAALAKKKAAAGGQSKVEKKLKPAAAPAAEEQYGPTIKSTNDKKPDLHMVDPPDVVMSLTPEDPRHALLDFTLEENKHLYEPWTKYCRTFRRGPGDQAMMVVEEILTKEGLI